jgi:putative FmdB family regulatory protein
VPTYEYACKSCGEHLEVVQSFRDDPLTECPACGGPLRKVFGAIGIAFKGSGFYKTDSRDSSSSGSSRKEPKEKVASSSDSSGSSTPASGTSTTGSDSADKSGGASSGKGDSKAAASS